MAQDGKEHRMLFDIRGRRRTAVKVVYAVLAVLMGISLFVVVGPVNIGELIGNGSNSSSAASTFESQAEDIEARLRKDPEDPDLLVSLMRARVNAANSLYEGGLEEERRATPEAVQQLQLASEAWSQYLEATNEPAAGAAQYIAPQLMTLAEFGGSITETVGNVEAAVEAQQIVADSRPNLGSLTTLAFFKAINAEYAQAEKVAAEAKKYANTKSERKALDSELERYEEVGRKFHKNIKEVERREAQAGEGGKQKLENPLGPELGGPGLGE